jgi:alpha-L-fucosidase
MKGGSGSFNRRRFVASSVGLLTAATRGTGQQGSSTSLNDYSQGNLVGDLGAGPFRPNWESLKAYRYPDWFRDAKFGIWAHWSPQCVPEQGDWYAHC